MICLIAPNKIKSIVVAKNELSSELRDKMALIERN